MYVVAIYYILASVTSITIHKFTNSQFTNSQLINSQFTNSQFTNSQFIITNSQIHNSQIHKFTIHKFTIYKFKIQNPAQFGWNCARLALLFSSHIFLFFSWDHSLEVKTVFLSVTILASAGVIWLPNSPKKGSVRMYLQYTVFSK